MRFHVPRIPLPLLLSAWLSACESGPMDTTNVLRIGTDVDAGTLDPRLMRNTTAYRVANLLYDGLVHLDEDLEPRPGLAERWHQPEPTVWVFELREGVTFHDGTPLTADDVAFTLNSILDPALGSPSRALFTPVRAVAATGEHTVRIDLYEPYAPLLRYLDIGIVPGRYLDSGGDPTTAPIGTGPMRFASWDRGARIALEPNARYWRGAPEVERVEFVIVADNTARAQAFEAGDLDIIQSPLSPQDIRRLEADPRFAHTITHGLAVTYLNFNTRHAPLDDRRVRRALSMLVDQRTIVGEIYRGVDRVATSLLLPSSWAFDFDVLQPDFDPVAATASLSEAGWADTDGDGVLDRDGQPLAITLSTHSEDPNRIQTLEFIQAVLREHGIDARVSISDWPAFFAGVQGGRHEIALLGWTQIVDPDRLMHGQLTTGGGLNYGGYGNADLDALLDEGRSATSREARAEAYRSAAAIIARDVPFFVISYQDYQVFHRSDIPLVADVRGMMRGAIGL